MSYFSEHHDHIRYLLGSDAKHGLRRSQIGALHAISAHFSLREQPAVVVLPTGAGKTAVLMLTPFMLCSQRTLVLTQSRFVREQIVKDYKALIILKVVQALPESTPPPTLFENKHLIRSVEAWEDFRQYDVVVSTPSSASPAKNLIPSPPEDLFDLVLIDEAHHSPAPTWNALMEAFPRARCVLFTATPFRRDGKEIKGKYLYTYPIQKAYEDGIYGDMLYMPVDPAPGIAADRALACETERVFKEDRAKEFSHVVMVRADSLPRSRQLEELYRQHTGLRLGVVDSGKSQRTTEDIVRELRAGELDGVICVNMLGEGFDLPNLKIAALHAPHRSLAVTLQFFGRFARVNGERLGKAKFLAVRDEISGDLSELFQESEAWGKRIQTIGQARIGEEESVREFLDEFQGKDLAGREASLDDLSLYSFNLFNHVKVYEVIGEVHLDASPEIPGFITEKIWVNDPRSTAAFLVREEIRPRWITTDGLNQVEYHLFVAYYDELSKLLFICATYREEWVYKEIAAAYIEGVSRPLSLSKTSRVLRRFSGLELFNVGMRNRKTGTVAESYRQLAGSAVHDAIDKSDGRLYHRGHIFGRGKTPAGNETIGLSSLSKIWRLDSTKIPKLIEWCQMLAMDIQNPALFSTGISLDHLDSGRDVAEIPDQIVLAADWPEEIYCKPPLVQLFTEEGILQSTSLLDFDLNIDRKTSCSDQIVVKIKGEASTCLAFSISPTPTIQYLDEVQPQWQIVLNHRSIDLADYLNANPLRFHLADGSLLEGGQVFEPPIPEEDIPFDVQSLMQGINWDAANVDIEKECVCDPPSRSIHDWLKDELLAGNAQVVFYDHRSGECADYLTVTADGEGVPAIRLYHCKGSGGASSGDRADDLFEVLGQATKSALWCGKKRLIQKVKKRARDGSVFYKGDIDVFLGLVESHVRSELVLEIFIVQPGVSKENLSPKMASLLSTTSKGLVSAGCLRLKVICSP